MKKLHSNNLTNTYYDNGIYELEFDVEGKEVFIRNIREKDHPNAGSDEWYFNNDDVIEEILRNANDKDIEITR